MNQKKYSLLYPDINARYRTLSDVTMHDLGMDQLCKKLSAKERCMHCLACIRVCRYGALTPERLKEGRPGPGCTLCRDCLSVCRHGGLAVTLYGKTCGAAESSFVVLLSIMHTVFLAVARV